MDTAAAESTYPAEDGGEARAADLYTQTRKDVHLLGRARDKQRVFLFFDGYLGRGREARGA